MDVHCCSLFGCHIAVGNVAPGCRVRGVSGGGRWASHLRLLSSGSVHVCWWLFVSCGHLFCHSQHWMWCDVVLGCSLLLSACVVVVGAVEWCWWLLVAQVMQQRWVVAMMVVVEKEMVCLLMLCMCCSRQMPLMRCSKREGCCLHGLLCNNCQNLLFIY